jgi:prevent-host-death family protein
LIDQEKEVNMGRVVSATEARIRFGELMRQAVDSHEPIIVERGGQSHVVVLSVEEYERLLRGQQQQDDWRDLVRQARERIQADLSGRELPPPEEILAQLREERDEQLLALR